MKDVIKDVLINKLRVEQVEVIDETEEHFGHSNYISGKSSHFFVSIKDDNLKKLSKIQQHREIYKALGQLMEKDIHALRIEVK